MTDFVLTQPATPAFALDQQKVYVRSSWGSPWFEANNTYCDWATWSVGGIHLNRAQLTIRYGSGKRPSDVDFIKLARGNPEASLRTWVMVEFGEDAAVWRWVGSVESIGDNQEGGSAVPFGELRLNCYGVELALQQHRIVDSVIQEGSSLAITRTARGIVFNNHNRGNRSKDLVGDSYVFGYDTPVAIANNSQLWSSLDMVKYLLAYQTPQPSGGAAPMTWVLDPSAEPYIPNYDAPILAQNGRRTLDLLDNLMTRERGIIWWYEYELDNDQMRVYATSFTDTPVSLGSGHTIPANSRIDTINVESDPNARDVLWTVQSIDQVDQIIMQGARRTSTFTINHVDDGTAAAAWTPAEETLYEDGASGWPDYPVAGEYLARRRLNAEARARDEVASVFSEITLPYDWDKLAGDGEGGEKQPVIPIDGDPTQSAPLFAKEAYFARNLSLLKGRDYSGNNINQETFKPHDQKPHEPVKPFALALPPSQRPLSPSLRRWLLSDKIGTVADQPYTTDYIDREWSCRVRVLPESTSLLLEVVGGQYGQHMIAGHSGNPQFTGLPEDLWDNAPEYDWREWIMTISLVEDRFCEYRFPADASIPMSNAVRRLVIDAGENYRRDYVVPNTVVGIDGDGYLQRTSSGGYVRDDTDKLEAITKAAWEWYGVERATVSFMTVFRDEVGAMSLGRFIKSLNAGANQSPVNSVVTQLKIIHTEVDEGQQAENALLSIETGFAELDPQAFIPAF